MKLYPTALSALQLMELMCYFSLYKFVSRHDEEMRQNKIISTDTHLRRKQKNLISMSAQVSGFVLEIVYLIFLSFFKAIGRKYNLFDVQEYYNAL